MHGDDQGLILPPRLAPLSGGDRADLQDRRGEGAACSRPRSKLRKELVDAGIRVKMDEREGMSPGFKFNDWEMRGVPLRIEIGPKDVAKGSVVLARRDRPGKEGKSFVPQQGIAAAVAQAARRNSEGALRPRARVPQSAHRRAGRLRRVQGGRREGICAFPGGAAAASARRKSRKRPKPPCAAFRSSSRAARGSASIAASRPPRKPSSPRPTERLRPDGRYRRVYSSQTQLASLLRLRLPSRAW